jgi:hypothetical protein
VTNPLYQQFYRKRGEDRDLLILDNGAYEARLNEKQLLERIGLYHPKVVVLPDAFDTVDWKLSFSISEGFHRVWAPRINVEWMYVPQGQTQSDYLHSIKAAMESFAPSWIGLPRIYGTKVRPSLRARADLAQWIHETWPDCNVHALGMLAGNTEELGLLEQSHVASIDSSAPVWRGWCGYDIADPSWQYNGTACDFDAYPFNGNDQLILKNLSKCGVIPHVISRD